MNKRKKVLFVISGLIIILISSLILFFTFSSGQKKEDISQNSESQTVHSEQMDDNSEEEFSDGNNTVSENSGSTLIPQQNHSEPVSNDESNAPLCSRQYLSDEEIRYCAEQMRQQLYEEDQRKIAQSTAEWCAENMPQIYDEYRNRLASEDTRYEGEIQAYVNSMKKSGAPGSESAHREIAEKMYSPLHIQNKNTILNNYASTVQGHGCDMTGYYL